jgi:hypothetical protein
MMAVIEKVIASLDVPVPVAVPNNADARRTPAAAISTVLSRRPREGRILVSLPVLRLSRSRSETPDAVAEYEAQQRL